jgi:hypothetical protein
MLAVFAQRGRRVFRMRVPITYEMKSFAMPFCDLALTEAEQRAADAAHVVLFKRRKRRRSPRLQASRTEDLGTVQATGVFRIEAVWADLIALAISMDTVSG